MLIILRPINYLRIYRLDHHLHHLLALPKGHDFQRDDGVATLQNAIPAIRDILYAGFRHHSNTDKWFQR